MIKFFEYRRPRAVACQERERKEEFFPVRLKIKNCGLRVSLYVEPTSSNTDIALAFVARVKRLKLFLTMPETMSIERRQLLKHLGAKLVLTPGPKGMKGAIEKAGEILKKEFKKLSNLFFSAGVQDLQCGGETIFSDLQLPEPLKAVQKNGEPGQDFQVYT